MMNVNSLEFNHTFVFLFSHAFTPSYLFIGSADASSVEICIVQSI